MYQNANSILDLFCNNEHLSHSMDLHKGIMHPHLILLRKIVEMLDDNTIVSNRIAVVSDLLLCILSMMLIDDWWGDAWGRMGSLMWRGRWNEWIGRSMLGVHVGVLLIIVIFGWVLGGTMIELLPRSMRGFLGVWLCNYRLGLDVDWGLLYSPTLFMPSSMCLVLGKMQ